ncbi:hypothetical protein ATY41_06110 [Leifsonia xyli subsp. xyli]|uniref:Integrase n=2 Tax=Leifsonia xyli subsp. xyli TaxID=59736 RepID=Q6ABZ8_LEIXX|nr:recombinase family protein [Leifsonia xyli]AAT90094.1 integrase [Leifsonia xyli subsp. xyli str. CTCB07]ODA89292.1 hypothetical protein ATY41_06110 [Leifsonia xyli subsp. xyli]
MKSATGSLRLDTDSDVAMARVLVAMANKSSADTARRVARASKQQAIDGRWHGGRASYGYRTGDSTLYVVPERAALVREASERVRAGESVYRIVNRWNQAGWVTMHGVRWSEKALKQILRNPVLKGVRTYRPVLPGGSWATAPEVVVEGNWTPILDADAWDETVAVLDARRARKNGGRTYSSKWVMPFSGLIRCGKCGHKMRKQGPNYICGHHTRGGCARSINAVAIQAFIEDAVLAAFSGPTSQAPPPARPGKRR